MTMAKSVWLLPALMLAAAPVFAAPKAVTKPASSARKPDAALLEFLGTWEAKDGHWVDPMTFARIDPDKAVRDQARRQGNLPLGNGKPGNKGNDTGGNGV
jgi:hypothetical protein